jgi:ABC-type uncharacterized transport system permease subunit
VEEKMAYSIILVLPVALLLIVLFAFLLKRLLKNKNPMELIVFGLELTVVGLFFTLNNNFDLNGFEIIFVIVGVIFSLSGILKNDTKER